MSTRTRRIRHDRHGLAGALGKKPQDVAARGPWGSVGCARRVAAAVHATQTCGRDKRRIVAIGRWGAWRAPSTHRSVWVRCARGHRGRAQGIPTFARRAPNDAVDHALLTWKHAMRRSGRPIGRRCKAHSKAHSAGTPDADPTGAARLCSHHAGARPTGESRTDRGIAPLMKHEPDGDRHDRVRREACRVLAGATRVPRLGLVRRRGPVRRGHRPARSGDGAGGRPRARRRGAER